MNKLRTAFSPLNERTVGRVTFARLSILGGLAAMALLGLCALVAIPAGAHNVNGKVKLTCDTASVDYFGFSAQDFPIVFHVRVLGVQHAITSDASTIPAGTASVDISDLTAVLNGKAGTLYGYVTWATSEVHSGETGPVPVTCGTPPTTAPPTTAPPTSTVPPTTAPRTVAKPTPPAVKAPVAVSSRPVVTG